MISFSHPPKIWSQKSDKNRLEQFILYKTSRALQDSGIITTNMPKDTYIFSRNDTTGIRSDASHAVKLEHSLTNLMSRRLNY